MKKKITQKAIRQRIDRALKKDGQVLRTDRKDGSLFIVDMQVGTIEAHDCTLAGVAEELGVLKPYEEMEVVG